MTDSKVVLITGGIRGIGLGIAKKFAAENCRVVMNYAHDVQQAEQAISEFDNNQAMTIKADISQASGRDTLIQTVIDTYGHIDILVNNAAILKMGRSLDITTECFETVMQCNFFGAFFLAQAVANQMIAQSRPGSIINILSVGAYGAANISYGTSKAALMYATRCMAKEMGKYNIRVNSISPNGVPTDLNKENIATSPERWQKAMQKVPLQREGSVEDMANAVWFLASEQASYINGVDIPVDGGFLC